MTLFTKFPQRVFQVLAILGIAFASLLLEDGSMATRFAVAQDAAKPAVDPSGSWRWEYDLDGTQYKDVIRLKLGGDINQGKEKEVKGKYESSSGRKADIENGKINGSKVTFEFKIKYQGMDVKLEFEGTIKNDAITGNIHATASEGSRDLPWNPTRSVLAEDVLGTWKMRIDANGNILEPVVTITKEGETLKATYASGNDLRIDAKNVKIDKNELCFSIDTEYQGTKIKADYMGRPYGDKIRGSIDYVLGTNSGEIEFTGERQSETK